MFENEGLKVVSSGAKEPLGKITNFDGLNYMYVKFGTTQRLLGGDAITIDADYSAYQGGTSSANVNKIDGVVQWDMDIDATSVAKYAWVIVPGGANPKNFLVNYGIVNHGGSIPNTATDLTNSALVAKASGGASAVYQGKVINTAMSSLTTAASAASDLYAAINANADVVTNLRAAGLRGVSAVSAYSATGTPASGGMFVPKKVYTITGTGANGTRLDATATGDSAIPVSADWQAGDIVVYQGAARVVVSATTVGASVAGYALLNSAFATSVSGDLDNTYLRIAKYRVKAIWAK